MSIMVRPTYEFGKLLDDLSTHKGRVISYSMYVLNLVFLGLYVLGTYDVSNSISSYILIAETILAIIFVFEYVSRLDFADSTWDEIKNPYSIADIIAVLPALLIFLVPFIGQVAFLRSLQIFRVFRFVRVGLEDDTFFHYDMTEKQVIIAEVLTTIILIVTMHAGLIFAFEHGVNSDISNYGSAFYYSVIALSTTGFGNVVPITILGKIVTSIGLIMAVTVIPWLVIRPRNTAENNKKCDNCHLEDHPEKAQFCHICGEELSENDTQGSESS